MSDYCDTCGAPVIKRADGKILNAEADPLGVLRADEGNISASEAIRGVRGTGPLLGHSRHVCAPIKQEALFDIEMPPARKRVR